MTSLYNVGSPINRNERNNINATFEDILRRFTNLQRQINTLAGDEEVDILLQRIEDAINLANDTTADGQQALNDISQALSVLSNIISDAEQLDENVQQALDGLTTALANFDTKGVYNASTTYHKNAIVRYGRDSYIALKTVTGITPTDDGVNWRLFAQGGIDGQGAVNKVNNVSPDGTGNVILQPADISAVSQEDFNQHLAHYDKSKNKSSFNHLNAQQLSQVRYNKPRPMLVIEYDDGSLEEYTLAYPVHQTYGVPATINIITKLIGKNDSEGNTFMTEEQIKELYNSGWEISNHTARHNHLGEENLVVNANSGDLKIYPNNAYAFRPDIGGATNGVITENNVSEVVTFIDNGSDVSGGFLVIDSPLRNNFTTAAKFRLTDDELITEILGAQKELERMGFEPNGIAYPYGFISPLSRKIVASSHNAGRNIGKDPDLNNGGVNDVRLKPLRTYGLYASEFSLLTNSEILNALNETVLVNGLCIMYAHPYSENFSVEKLAYLIEQAQSLGIEIVTRSKALLYFGNLLEIGDFIEEESQPYPAYLVVGQNKEVFTGTINAGNGSNLSFFTANGTPFIQGRNADLNIGSRSSHDLVLRTGDGTPFGSTEIVRLRHETNDIEITQNGGGIIFKSPDGLTKRKLTIDNGGNAVWSGV